MTNGEDLRGIDLERVASPIERATAVVTLAALACVFAAVAPWATRPELAVPGFMPVFGGAMVVIDLVLAVLLFSKGAIAQRSGPITLATAYLFSAMIVVPHIASFPGAIMPDGLLGTSATAVWLWSFWHAGFAIAIIRYVVRRKAVARPQAILRIVIVTAAIVVVLSLVATIGQHWLPSVLTGQTYQANIFSLVLQTVVVFSNVAAFVAVVGRLRFRTAEDLWLGVAMLAACVDVGLTFLAGSRFSLGWYAGRAAALVTSLVVLVSLFRDILQLYAAVGRANLELARLAHVDGLTGLPNRRHLDYTMAQECGRARRDKRPLAVVMVDVDHFKPFNDRYGHQAGDQCLRHISDALRDSVQRPGDFVARYGGEEFALVLPATDLPGALHVADVLREAVRSLALPHDGSPFGIVTVSVGVASAKPYADDDAEVLLAEADAALYRAKQSGRDQVRSGIVDGQPRLALVGGDVADAKVA